VVPLDHLTGMLTWILEDEFACWEWTTRHRSVQELQSRPWRLLTPLLLWRQVLLQSRPSLLAGYADPLRRHADADPAYLPPQSGCGQPDTTSANGASRAGSEPGPTTRGPALTGSWRD
jgi:hypothetical protein